MPAPQRARWPPQNRLTPGYHLRAKQKASANNRIPPGWLSALAKKALAMVDIHDGDPFAFPAPDAKLFRSCVRMDLLAGFEAAAWANDVSVLHCDHFTIIVFTIQ